jgi:N-formylglutamate amidohydrolase
MPSASHAPAPFALFHVEDAPILVTAIHDGHTVRDELHPWLRLDETARLREEDPYTGCWAMMFPSHVVGLHSRFEVDLNRPRDKAVYRTPDDAWGLDVWSPDLPKSQIASSLGQYDWFYARMKRTLDALVNKHGQVVVLDIHSYNHQRGGPGAGVADPDANPEINVGTGTMDRARWGKVVDQFIADLSDVSVEGRQFDVRENVRFQGGQFPRWIHETWPHSVVALAVEVKKFFMNEWSGELNQFEFLAVGEALRATMNGLCRTVEEIAREQAA